MQTAPTPRIQVLKKVGVVATALVMQERGLSSILEFMPSPGTRAEVGSEGRPLHHPEGLLGCCPAKTVFSKVRKVKCASAVPTAVERRCRSIWYRLARAASVHSQRAKASSETLYSNCFLFLPLHCMMLCVAALYPAACRSFVRRMLTCWL